MKVGHWVGESAEGGGQVEVAGSGHVSDHERSAQAGDLTCGLPQRSRIELSRVLVIYVELYSLQLHQFRFPDACKLPERSAWGNVWRERKDRHTP